MILSREQILEKNDLPSELVEVPEWGGAVWVRGMSGAERDSFEDSIIAGEKGSRVVNISNFRAKLAVRSIVDEQGRRLFTDDDADLLGAKSAAGLQRIVEVAKRLSAFSPEDVSELTKN